MAVYERHARGARIKGDKMLETAHEVIIDRIEMECYEELCESMSPVCIEFDARLEQLVEDAIDKAYKEGILSDS